MLPQPVYVPHSIIADHDSGRRLTRLAHILIQITIHLPKTCDLYLRVPAGDVSVEGISGNKDIELHAGDLSIRVGDPLEYAHVDASVNAGDVEASPFGESHSGLFRSFQKSGAGKYRLHAHVGAGDLTLL